MIPISFVSTLEQRNPPALWGTGQIDALPVEILEAQRVKALEDHPKLSGRLPQTATGELGRFGWKGEVARLDEAVRLAFSNDLGLMTPGVKQAPYIASVSGGHFSPTPQPPMFTMRDVQSEQYDVSIESVQDMVAYLQSLTPPDAPRQNRDGEVLFTEMGCGGCHVPELGPIQGIFSDLLLHDMGPQLNADDQAVLEWGGQEVNDGVAQSQEWRTPPLWGLWATAPYLHDGRADTLQQAIEAHGGEALLAKEAWMVASHSEQQALTGFLNTLCVCRHQNSVCFSTVSEHQT